MRSNIIILEIDDLLTNEITLVLGYFCLKCVKRLPAENSTYILLGFSVEIKRLFMIV